ncbi:guanylate-binding protein 1-like [Mercenaria mercenaria]|uniref:guanylate-binding protein 1-like n=1 Tax=Mercenaria mercenaria TaxID=6596 RepID=UPI00234E8C28|nr:guanylate-binding protein 1-like [Mercenaria mercenaria]
MISPDLLLCIGDFCLQLDGKKVDEYLDYFIKSVEGDSQIHEKYNRSISCIKRRFPNRKCFKLNHAVEKATLSDLHQMKEAEYSSDCNADIRNIDAYLCEMYPHHVCSDTKIDGWIFTSVVRRHTDSVNANKVPLKQDALQGAYKQANEKYITLISDKFLQDAKSIELPVVNSERFEEMFSKMIDDSLADLRQLLWYDDTRVLEGYAIKQMGRIKDEIEQRNCELVEESCGSVLYQLYDRIVGLEQHYMRTDGHESYRAAISTLKTEYRAQCGKADIKLTERTLQKFLDEKSETEYRIRMEDHRLTEEICERRKEQIRLEQDRQIQNIICSYEDHKRTEECMRREVEVLFRKNIYERKENENITHEAAKEEDEKTNNNMCIELERRLDGKFKETERRKIQLEGRAEKEQWGRLETEIEERERELNVFDTRLEEFREKLSARQKREEEMQNELRHLINEIKIQNDTKKDPEITSKL